MTPNEDIKSAILEALKNYNLSIILTDYLVLEIPFQVFDKECWIDLEIDTNYNEIKLLTIFIDGEEIDSSIVTDEEILNLLNIY